MNSELKSPGDDCLLIFDNLLNLRICGFVPVKNRKILFTPDYLYLCAYLNL